MLGILRMFGALLVLVILLVLVASVDAFPRRRAAGACGSAQATSCAGAVVFVAPAACTGTPQAGCAGAKQAAPAACTGTVAACVGATSACTGATFAPNRFGLFRRGACR